jgi:hypothetical protein
MSKMVIKRNILIPIGIIFASVIFAIFPPMLLKHFFVLANLDNYSISIILYEATRVGETYLIEIEPNIISVCKGIRADDTPDKSGFKKIIKIESKKEKYLLDSEMYDMISLIDNINLHSYSKIFVGIGRWEAIMYLNGKAYQLHYTAPSADNNFVEFIDMLIDYSLVERDFEIGGSDKYLN